MKVFSDPSVVIDVDIGERFLISLESNPTTGFEWECTSRNAAIVRYPRRREAANGSAQAKVGAACYEIFEFELTSDFQGQIDFELKRSWERAARAKLSFKTKSN